MEPLRQTDYRSTEAALPKPPLARENVISALARELPEFQPALFPHDGHAVLCGSGPSLPSIIEEIRAEREKRRPIVAVKGAHDLLCEHGIEPDAFVSCEAKPRLENVQRSNDHTVYFLSSRCAPELFDHLRDRKVVIWHPYMPEQMPEMIGRQQIGGGTTSGLRAVTLLWLLGYSKFELYGFDSCIDLKSKKKRYDSGAMSPELLTDRIIFGRRFICNAAMAMQCDEFQEYYKMLPGVSFHAHGGGALAAIIKHRERLGLRT